ncbi:hypothetical protein [Hyphococcus sp.]|uniref:hypothetical protein n=1 Tax=Hyphococcus sp. TaxID=2038636 RepID=UPI00208BBF90|nr:MAG: hypothetical protein DHS20C04_17480 [Marinicaulis sp.]
MLNAIAIGALVVLVGVESFAFSGAVLWALSEFMHLGKLVEEGAIGLAALIGLCAGFWIFKSATSNADL